MNLLAAMLLVSSLTTPIPPDITPPPNLDIYDTPDVYGEEPSVTAMDVSEVRSRLMRLGYSPITEVKFTGGRWRVTAYRAGEKRKLELDENSGVILADRPFRG
jgi:hypothetical protein